MPLHPAWDGGLEDIVTTILQPTLDPASFIRTFLDESVATMAAFRDDPATHDTLSRMADAVAASMMAGGTLLVCGNGGSAADAQHIAGEFVGRLLYDRAPLPAIALSTDTSVMTAVANDYGYAHVFSRQVLALGRAGDVLLGISTSGTSANVLAALDAGRERGMVCLGFTGADGASMRDACDLLLPVPSRQNVFIQQMHITAAHVICALVERAIHPRV